MVQIYYIYSIEHQAWWKPLKRGYTQDISEAGTYIWEEVLEICKDANFSKVEEIPVEVNIGDQVFK